MKKYIPVYVLIAMVILPFTINPHRFTLKYFTDDYLAHLLDYNYPATGNSSDTILIEKNWKIDNHTRQHHFGNYYTWWKSPDINISPETALENYKDGAFRKWRYSRFGQWYNNSHYWYHFILTNNSSSTETMLIYVNNNRSNAGLYKVKSGDNDSCILIGKTSGHLPVEERENYNQEQLFYFDVPPYSTEVYLLNIQKTIKANMVFAITLHHSSYNLSRMNMTAHIHFAFLGFFGFMIALTLVLYFAFKEKVYLYQSFYIGAMALFICSFFGIDAALMSNWLYTPYSYLEPVLLSLIGAWFFILIFMELTEIKAIAPRYIRLIRLLQRLNLAACFSSIFSSACFFFVPQQYYLTLNSYLQIPILLFFLTFFIGFTFITIKIFNRVRAYSKVYLVMIIAVLILWLIQVMNYIGISNFHLAYHNNLFIGLSMETILFTYVMLRRFWNDRKERIELLQTKLFLQNELLTSVIDAQESERKRIAQELHDGLGGYLSALRMMVNRKKNSFSEKDDEESAKSFADVQDKLDKAIKDVREISHNLMPSELENANFSNLLKEHIEYLNENGTIVYEYFIDEKVNHCDKSLLISLYRITSELIRNIQKHSGATKATIQLIVHEENVQLQVEDNGYGFSGKIETGIGLKNIQSRVQYLNGTLNIDSGKLGTTFIIEIPLIPNT